MISKRNRSVSLRDPGTPQSHRRSAGEIPEGGSDRRRSALGAVIAAGLSAVVAGLGPTTLPAAQAANVAAQAAAQPANPPATPPAAPGSPAVPKKSPVSQIKTRLDLKEPFNLGRGKVRIIAFYSPTCMHCIVNAQSLQKQVLEQLDSPDIEVFALWLKVTEDDVFETAERGTTILHDRRVRHYYDPNRVLNAQLLDAIALDVQVRIYNVTLLYDRDAAWDSRLPRPPYWMHEFRGAPGPDWDAAAFGSQVVKALDRQPLDAPVPR